jgi:hypothetical protein
LTDNYLSTEARIPVACAHQYLQSAGNQCTGGQPQDNFSSQSFKQLPSVGT